MTDPISPEIFYLSSTSEYPILNQINFYKLVDIINEINKMCLTPDARSLRKLW